LRKGLDSRKDQSYFLVPERPEGLDRVMFPLGERTKAEVRAEAGRVGLPVREKAESQDACFVPEGGLASFLEARLGPGAPGEVVDAGGQRLGSHAGLHPYTVGQRRGLGVSAPEPLYVLRKEAGANRLVVGSRQEATASGFSAGGAVWLVAPSAERFDCAVKIRSTAREVPCTVAVRGDQARVAFAQPQFGVAPGQMAVFYDGDEVLGGAWID
jgi:tRNA-specific 2-thiouridylase